MTQRIATESNMIMPVHILEGSHNVGFYTVHTIGAGAYKTQHNGIHIDNHSMEVWGGHCTQNSISFTYSVQQYHVIINLLSKGL